MTDNSPVVNDTSGSQFIGSSGRAYLIMVFSVFCLSSNHVVGRFIHAELPPVGLSFWRWFVSALILLPFVWSHRHVFVPVVRENIRFLASMGSLMVVSTTFILVALHFTTAINVSVINATQPSLTVLLSAIVLKDHLGKVQVLGIITALIGVLVMVSQGSWQAMVGLHFNRGDLIALLAMLGFSSYSINVRKLPTALTAVEILFVLNLLGALSILPIYLLESAFYKPVPVNMMAFAVVGGLAIMVSILAMVAWNIGNRMIGANRASAFVNLMPVFGAILAMTFLGERLYAYHFAGAILIGTGLFMVLKWHKTAEKT
jgi:drug/metabolite transporter (DMT)-like permease